MHICIYVYVITIFLETNYLFIVLYVGQLQTSEFIQFFSLIRRAFPLTFSRNESNAVLRTRADGKCLSQLAHWSRIDFYIYYVYNGILHFEGKNCRACKWYIWCQCDLSFVNTYRSMPFLGEVVIERRDCKTQMGRIVLRLWEYRTRSRNFVYHLTAITQRFASGLQGSSRLDSIDSN